VSRLALALALVLLAGGAQAHDTWLLPRSFRAGPGATLLVELTSGMSFPDLDHAPEAQRLAVAKLRLVGQTTEIQKPERGEHALALTALVRYAGLAAVWVSTKPTTLDLEEALVEEYLDEIGAQHVKRQWNERKAPKTWRETYRKHAKTFVRVGGSDESWKEPVGLDLEIVPESDPAELRAGTNLGLRVLKRGRPLPGFVVAGVAKGAARRLATTDAEGRASLVLDKPGPWLLAGTEIRAKGDAWESDFTTLTLELAP